MPEISRFLGIVIYMYYKKHGIPHFHAEYNEYNASISIENSEVIDGYLPSRIMGFITEWVNEHKNELFDNWERSRNKETLNKIKPLV